jgi:hypothetical protein
MQPETPPPTAGTLSAVRALYLATAGVAADLLERREVRDRWDDASVLDRMTVGDLAGHLGRSVTLVEDFLDAPEPAPGEGVDAARYFAGVDGLTEADSAVNAGIRTRSQEAAAGGPDAVAVRVRSCLDGLAARLADVPAQRRVVAFGGRTITLDEFLRTRLVELCLHVEDLELSVGLGPGVDAVDDVADLPYDAVADAVAVLVAAARARHGDAAVLRALARRERDAVHALRVF